MKSYKLNPIQATVFVVVAVFGLWGVLVGIYYQSFEVGYQAYANGITWLFHSLISIFDPIIPK